VKTTNITRIRPWDECSGRAVERESHQPGHVIVQMPCASENDRQQQNASRRGWGVPAVVGGSPPRVGPVLESWSACWYIDMRYMW
ncbi:MAG: hypothetical protein P8090_10775, partial [Gammaproteobacteria bacterium]